MGLPIWRDPEEKQVGKDAGKDAIKADPTAAARSSIRRRPAIDPARRPSRVHLPRDEYTWRSPPPPRSHVRYYHWPEHDSRVPPVPTVLDSTGRVSLRPPSPPPDSAERSSTYHQRPLPHIAAAIEAVHRASTHPPPPPPPVPESRNYFHASPEQIERPTSEHERSRHSRLGHDRRGQEMERRRNATLLSLDDSQDLHPRPPHYHRQMDRVRHPSDLSGVLVPLQPSDPYHYHWGRPSSHEHAQPRRTSPGIRSLLPPTLERSPQRESASDPRPLSRDGGADRWNTLPPPLPRSPPPNWLPPHHWPHALPPMHRTPPPPLELEGSGLDPADMFVMQEADPGVSRARFGRTSHPLSNSWRPDSPINGLGDRNRSPPPADGWEIMRTTITPDATLPSADSSFTSAAASSSFSSSNDTGITEPDRDDFIDRADEQIRMIRERMRHIEHLSDSGSASPSSSQADDAENGNDLICIDDDSSEVSSLLDGDEVAMVMYEQAQDTQEGRARIEAYRRGNSGPSEDYLNEEHDIGQRLLEEAMETSEGRARVREITFAIGEADEIVNAEMPRAEPSRFAENVRRRARHITDRTARFFHHNDTSNESTRPRALDLPPRYSPLPPEPNASTSASQDLPQAHPVSPPAVAHRIATPMTQPLRSEVYNANLDEDELDRMRRIVERLARRDDVPEEWWMSVGLRSLGRSSRRRNRSHSGWQERNPLSHTSPSATSRPAQDRSERLDRVRGGRIERGESRL